MKIVKLPRIHFFILSGAVMFCGLVLIVVILVSGGRIQQPLAFNHKIHSENDLECLDCHLYFKDHSSSGRPTLEICSNCHEEPLGESRQEKKLIEFIESDREIEWQRLFRVPEDVYFSHRRHVVLGGLECKICHGTIGESTSPPTKPKQISMKTCMGCHEENEVDNDCIACHR